MSHAFSFEVSPFNALDSTEQVLVRDTARCLPFQATNPLLLPDTAPEHLWVIHSGHAQLDEDGHVHVLTQGEAIS